MCILKQVPDFEQTSLSENEYKSRLYERVISQSLATLITPINVFWERVHEVFL